MSEYIAYWRSYNAAGDTEGEAGRSLYYKISSYATRLYGEGGLEAGEAVAPVIIVSPDGTETVYPCEINADTKCFKILSPEVK